MIPSTFIPGCITRARLILLPRGYPEKPSSRVLPEIYCKELAHRTVEVGEPPGARGESAGWTPRGAGGLAPVPRRAGSRPRKSQCSRHKIVFHLSFRTCITAPNGEHHSGGDCDTGRRMQWTEPVPIPLFLGLWANIKCSISSSQFNILCSLSKDNILNALLEQGDRTDKIHKRTKKKCSKL